MTGVSYAAAGTHRLLLLLVAFCLAVNWFGDSLDGTLARVRRQQRPRYGFYVDHMVDAFGVPFLVGGVALSGFMSPLVAIGLLVAYFMLSIEIYLATYCLAVFRLSFSGLGGTELRIVLAIGTLKLLSGSTVTLLGHRFLLFDVGGVVAIGGIAVTLIGSAIRNARVLYRAERLPERHAQVAYLLATAIAIELTIVHNFVWHVHWTWRDRPVPAIDLARRLVVFNLANGAISIFGNLGLMAVLVDVAGVQYLLANLLSAIACSLANFAVSDVVVFARCNSTTCPKPTR